MHNSKLNKQSSTHNAPETGRRHAGPGTASRIAPAVALLMLGDSAYAQIAEDNDSIPVPEPSILALLAAGAVIGGAAKYVHNKRRKK